MLTLSFLLGAALHVIDPPPVVTIPRGEVPTLVSPLPKPIVNPKGSP